MKPGKPHINFEALRSMLVLNQTGSYKSYKFPDSESLDDDCVNLLDPEYNHDLLDQLIVETWIHNDPYLPNPELDKALLELVKLFEKIARDGSHWDENNNIIQKYGGT